MEQKKGQRAKKAILTSNLHGPSPTDDSSVPLSIDTIPGVTLTPVFVSAIMVLHCLSCNIYTGLQVLHFGVRIHLLHIHMVFVIYPLIHTFEHNPKLRGIYSRGGNALNGDGPVLHNVVGRLRLLYEHRWAHSVVMRVPLATNQRCRVQKLT